MMISSRNMIDFTTSVRLKQRLKRKINMLKCDTASMNSHAQNVVLIGASRLGKNSIARELEQRGCLSHFEVDSFAKFFVKFSSFEFKSYMVDHILNRVLSTCPYNVVIEGAYLSIPFVDPKTHDIDWLAFGKWIDNIRLYGAKVIVLVTDATQDYYLRAIYRGREANMCWSNKIWKQEDLPELARLLMQKNALMQKLATDRRVESVCISLENRCEHDHSIQNAIQYFTQKASNV